MEINSLFKKYFNNQEFIDGFMEAEAENPILTESINKDFEYKDNSIEDMSKAKDVDSLGEKYAQRRKLMRNTFEGFIVNDSNKEAFEFANKVAKQETTEANPLFISGPHGCGKSHLIDGIWHYYVCADNGKHLEWTSSFALTERFKNFTQGKCQFADKFNELDLLLFDDIDLVDDKCNGELLSQVIDELIKRGKQICVASTKPLNELSPTLKDVFSKGKCVTVSLPTKDEQRDFYKQLSKREGISLHGEEPYDYLCEKQKDFRTMKAELVRLKYNMILENCETASLGVGVVKRYLEN